MGYADLFVQSARAEHGQRIADAGMGAAMIELRRQRRREQRLAFSRSMSTVVRRLRHRTSGTASNGADGGHQGEVLIGVTPG